ncbi:hypothetical protein IFM89_036516 [Coptis chinensis]|uniref:Uncharacterized protein n=1 Tax=Coptis chinensis TaxID=261450 RepID=A0A835LJS1_9MAGN|nr:hypothetical protein IFM89_036516 [Coptis chinensis]
MKLATALTLFLVLRFVLTNGIKSTTKHYIVYLGKHSHPNLDSVILANHEMLAAVTGSVDGAQHAAVQHYSKNFRGFSAMLTPEQAEQLEKNESVVSVFESRTNPVHTTHSWDFLGVDSVNQYNKLMRTDYKSDVIVGVIDTGVWPESQSFNDKGLGPAPKRFKGECVVGEQLTSAHCNRKLIGARFYSKGFEAENGPLESFNKTFIRSARDTDGHGSHTASTVAGSVVTNVSLFGIATGTARGGAPNARLAIYKACWFNLCSDADLLLAFDDATNDGVDIISLSVGPLPPQPSFFSDAISIGSFHAFSKGIFVSASAGNSGLPSTAANVAPWIFTVAASSVDRDFTSNVHLGNSKMLKGSSLNPLTMDKQYGIIAATTAAAPGVSPQNASFCKINTLDQTLIKGKIVVCTTETVLDNRQDKSIVVKQGGGVGMILIDPIAKDVGFQFVIPATLIGQKEALELQAYLTTDKNPVAIIYPTTTVLNTKPAPTMAVFSSMGPNVINPDIIKPDITAPGVNILAAWSPLATEEAAERSVDFNIISGTSMSCPHVSAIAAIIKSCHPSWSPSAIKSAIMTTATVIDNNDTLISRDPFGSQTTPFDYGSGHVNPAAALDPGLVYDFNTQDIIEFLCSNGAGLAEFKNLTGEPLTCKNHTTPSYNLNYPSVGIGNMNGTVTAIRTVTYYGKGPTVYLSYVESPEGVKIGVIPHRLRFKKAGQKKTFKIKFTPYKNSNGSFVFGSLTWRNGIQSVRSPIGLNVVSV